MSGPSKPLSQRISRASEVLGQGEYRWHKTDGARRVDPGSRSTVRCVSCYTDMPARWSKDNGPRCIPCKRAYEHRAQGREDTPKQGATADDR